MDKKHRFNKIDIKEFREKGYLQELNRQFLHPLGLALEVEVNDDGSEKLGGIWDYRNDPEGILFSEDMIDKDKILFISKEKNKRISTRLLKNCDKEGIQKNALREKKPTVLITDFFVIKEAEDFIYLICQKKNSKNKELVTTNAVIRLDYETCVAETIDCFYKF